MIIPIDVTEQDISSGMKHDSERCPIALAVTRKGFTGVQVGGNICFYNAQGELYDIATTPGIAKKFIRMFDEGNQVFPLSFEIDMLGIYGIVAMARA